LGQVYRLEIWLLWPPNVKKPWGDKKPAAANSCRVLRKLSVSNLLLQPSNLSFSLSPTNLGALASTLLSLVLEVLASTQPLLVVSRLMPCVNKSEISSRLLDRELLVLLRQLLGFLDGVWNERTALPAVPPAALFTKPIVRLGESSLQ
jgi:hypothetical protein